MTVARARTRRAGIAGARMKSEGMTLLEILVVLAIMVLAASGVSFSVGALARANLKAAAGRLGAATRYAYNRAVTHGQTTRLHFTLPGNTFSIEEAHAGVTLATKKDREDQEAPGAEGIQGGAIDPWAAAQARVAQPLAATVGASPFTGIADADGKAIKRYNEVSLGRDVQFLKLIVAHEPEPLTEGDGAVHFFAGGHTEHAVIQLGDGHGAVYSIEIHPLTGRVKVYPEAYEPEDLLDDPDNQDVSEVDAP